MPDTCPDCGCPLAEPVEGVAYAEMHIADERGGLVCLRRQLAAAQAEAQRFFGLLGSRNAQLAIAQIEIKRLNAMQNVKQAVEEEKK